MNSVTWENAADLPWYRQLKYWYWNRRHCARGGPHLIDTAHYFMTGEQRCWACRVSNG